VVNRCVEPGTECMTKVMHADAHRHPGATPEHMLAVASKQEICTTPNVPGSTTNPSVKTN
jgi:hypothetical protein